MSKYSRKHMSHISHVKCPSWGKMQTKLHPILKINIPWHTIHIDITGKLSGKSDQKYVIVQIDAFTKYNILKHTFKRTVVFCFCAPIFTFFDFVFCLLSLSSVVRSAVWCCFLYAHKLHCSPILSLSLFRSPTQNLKFLSVQLAWEFWSCVFVSDYRQKWKQ